MPAGRGCPAADFYAIASSALDIFIFPFWNTTTLLAANKAGRKCHIQPGMPFFLSQNRVVSRDKQLFASKILNYRNPWIGIFLFFGGDRSLTSKERIERNGFITFSLGLKYQFPHFCSIYQSIDPTLFFLWTQPGMLKLFSSPSEMWVNISG